MNAFTLAADRVRAAGRALAFARELVLPSGCALCGQALSRPDDARCGLCAPCRNTLRPVLSGGGLCAVCGKPLISERGTCMACRRFGGAVFDRALLLFPYRGDYRGLLAAWKFGGRRALGRFFAECLAEAPEILAPPETTRSGAAWVPVPPRPGKIRKAGWDQVESLARLLEHAAPARPPIPVRRCLRRLPSEVQKTLGREERRRNLAGNIRVKASWTGRLPETAFLFDDVYTTGSTLNACAGALKAGGVQRVYAVCLFYD